MKTRLVVCEKGRENEILPVPGRTKSRACGSGRNRYATISARAERTLGSQTDGGEVVHPLGDGLVALGGGRGCGAINGGQEGGAVGGEQGGVGGQGLGGVVDIALAAGGQAGAGEGVVEGGAEGVDIGPGTHVAIGGALLGGAEAGGFDDAVAEIAVGFAGGAEIDDDGEAGAGDEDVVGLDIAVQELAAVQVVERIEQAHHEAKEAGLGDGGTHGGMLRGKFVERDAVDEFDHVVGGAVFLEVGVDFGDAGVV